MTNLNEFFGDIDIYLFDQILKNRFAPEMKILDAGCGGGRNLVYFFEAVSKFSALTETRKRLNMFAISRKHSRPKFHRKIFKFRASKKCLLLMKILIGF